MADDSEQIDILGDFDFKLEADTDIYDANELPSKSANLLPEYTNPPWMLEQGWTLDNCMDEKSKATIEKMLMEEQYYLNGKASTRSKPKREFVNQGKTPAVSKSPKEKLTVTAAPCKASVASRTDRHTVKRTWSEEEKNMFLKGLELYGRSWTKISELIPSRTSMQIKNFAHQYFKAKSRKVDDTTSSLNVTATDSSTSDLPSLNQVLLNVATAQPTVPIREATLVYRSSPSKFLQQIRNSSTSSAVRNLELGSLAQVADLIRTRTVSTMEKASSSSLSSVMDSMVHKQSSVNFVSIPRNQIDNLETKPSLTPALIENLDRFCAVANIIAGEAEESNDEDIDIDIENDDDSEDENPVLKSRSTSPNSVYDKLLKEANLKLMQSRHLSEDKHKILPDSNGCDYKSESKPTPMSSYIHTEREDTLTDTSSPFDPSTACQTQRDKSNFKTEKHEDSPSNLTGGDEKDGRTFKEDGTPNGVSLEKCLTDSESSQSEAESGMEEKSLQQRRHYINAVLMCEGELVEFPIPTTAGYLDQDTILDEEKKIHMEFFDSRPSSKTPERYLKIRNYIIDTWKKCKPNYLNKTSVRPGLKNCGDVNCIGRIHAYLECTGVINFGCEQACYNNPARVFVPLMKEKSCKEGGKELNVAKLDAMRPRKRRIRDAFGYWIDEKEFEGKTIEHDGDRHKESQSGSSSKTKILKPVYDPFQLVPCRVFTDTSPPPFSVTMCNTALMVMDIHAHISKTEVIGMLGGQFCDQQGQLTITMATPCNSISTGMQCEMDPVSQTQASEEINTAGMSVVGWYHSHPTFAPNPSIRDIETQLKFQNWFSKGGRNFVGVIISPYSPANQGLGSEVKCLTVGEEWVPELQCNIPYSFEYSKKGYDGADLKHVTETAQSLSLKYATYKNRVDLSTTYRAALGISCLDKMLQSINQYCTDQDVSETVDSLRDVFTQEPIPTSQECLDSQYD